MKLDIGPYLVRLVITILVSVVVVAAINEGAYLFQKEKYDRPPKTIQMVIPAGTAERLAEGESIDSIPEKMVFVIGDVLEVINQDAVSHQLGPVWVPAGATGRLELNEPNRYAYSCSFSNTRYLGLDVRKPTGLDTRLSALALLNAVYRYNNSARRLEPVAAMIQPHEWPRPFGAAQCRRSPIGIGNIGTRGYLRRGCPAGWCRPRYLCRS